MSVYPGVGTVHSSSQNNHLCTYLTVGACPGLYGTVRQLVISPDHVSVCKCVSVSKGLGHDISTALCMPGILVMLAQIR